MLGRVSIFLSFFTLALAAEASAQGVFDMQNAEAQNVGHIYTTVGSPTREVKYHGHRAYIINDEALCLLGPRDFASFSTMYSVSGHVDGITAVNLTNKQTGVFAGQRQIYVMSHCRFNPVTAANADETLNSAADSAMGKVARSLGQNYDPPVRATSGMRPTDRATDEQAVLLGQHYDDCMKIRANRFNGICFRGHKAELDADIQENIEYNQEHGYR